MAIRRSPTTRTSHNRQTLAGELPKRLGGRFDLEKASAFPREKHYTWQFLVRQAVLINDPHTACQTLVALARERGGPDNISVGVVRLIAPAEAGKPVPETREVEVKL